MLVYLIKSAACMAIFFVFYKLLLEKENMHVFKRFYLLLAIGTSLLIPALVFTEYVVADPVTYTNVQQPIVSDYDYIGVPAALENDVLDIEPMLWAVYFLGLIFFGLKFIKNLFQIIWRIRKNPKQKASRFIQVLLQENFPPHTFFSYIFLNKSKLESNEIPKEVLLHEETHARQMHSWDVVFIEVLQVIFWFNPLIYVFKKAIKLNHEFLADQAVLEKDIDKITYQNTLLSYLSPDSQNKYQSKLANAINYSSVKKRFTVMKTHTSKKAMLLRSLFLLPMLALMLLGFSETKLVEVSPPNSSEIQEKASPQELVSYTELAKKYNAIAIEERKIPLEDLRVLETIFKRMDAEQKANSEPFPECLPKNAQDGASRKLMAEYNALAKKYNSMLSESKSIRIEMKDVERLEYIYGLMSDKQKADAEPFPHFPDPPPPPKAPKAPEVKAPKVKKGEKSDIPAPPPPQEIEIEEIKEVEEALEAEEIAEVEAIDKVERIAVTPPVAPMPPKSPLDHVIEMAKRGATFYYEGQKITSDKAVELLKDNKNLNIESTGKSSKNPKVKITKGPIYHGKASNSSRSIETGNTEINGEKVFYSKKDGVTSYFNNAGEHIDRNGKILNKNSKNHPTFYFNKRQISSDKANRLLSSNNSIQVTSKEYKNGKYAILLTDLDIYQDTNRNYNPNSAIDLTEMIEKEASFFYNDEPITVEKALWLTQNTHIERVNTVASKIGKTKVYFWSKA